MINEVSYPFYYGPKFRCWKLNQIDVNIIISIVLSTSSAMCHDVIVSSGYYQALSSTMWWFWPAVFFTADTRDNSPAAARMLAVHPCSYTLSLMSPLASSSSRCYRVAVCHWIAAVTSSWRRDVIVTCRCLSQVVNCPWCTATARRDLSLRPIRFHIDLETGSTRRRV